MAAMIKNLLQLFTGFNLVPWPYYRFLEIEHAISYIYRLVKFSCKFNNVTPDIGGQGNVSTESGWLDIEIEYSPG